MHSAAIPLPDSALFLFATYACPVQLGNRIHEFLNAFAAAVVTNRTLVWRYSRQPGYPASEEECGRLLHRRSWIWSESAAQTYNPNVAWKPLDLGLHIHDAPRRLACALLHPAVRTARVVSLGALEWQQAASLAAPGAFANQRHSLASAATLFSLGSDFAFGALFQSAFAWSESLVVDMTHATLQAAGLGSAGHSERASEEPLVPLTSAIWLGVHMRAQSESNDGTGLFPSFSRAISEVLDAHCPTGGIVPSTRDVNITEKPCCVILLASDREASTAMLMPVAKQRGCVLVRSKRGEAEAPGLTTEHGRYTRDTAMRDVYLLSHADHLIGTSGSTFSLLMAEQLAFRQGNRNRQALIRLCAQNAESSCSAPASLVRRARDQNVSQVRVSCGKQMPGKETNCWLPVAARAEAVSCKWSWVNAVQTWWRPW